MNKISNLLILSVMLLASVGGFVGCSSTEANVTVKNGAKPADNKNTATMTEASKTPANVAPANVSTNAAENKPGETASTGDKIGVPECDEYIEKYEACINKNVPETARNMMKTTFEQSRASWKAAAANPQAKASLGSACKQAMEAAKAATAAYKCDF